MIARYALIATSTKTIEILFVKSADNVRHVVAIVINCVGNLVRRLDSGDCQLRRRNNKTFIDEDFGACWMVHSHQGQLIVVVSFPKLSCYAQVVVAIAWGKIPAINLVPLFSSFDFCRAERVDAQPNRGTPGHGIFDKLHFLTVIREEKRT